MVEGRLAQVTGEITLLASPSSRTRTERRELLKAAGPVLRFERFEVGAGIEKNRKTLPPRFMAQVSAAGKR